MSQPTKRYSFLFTIIVLIWHTTTSAQEVEIHGSGSIQNVSTPIDDQDAVTKGYLDSLLINLGAAFGAEGVQKLLDLGYHPLTLVGKGVPVDSLYGRMYEGGLIFYLDVMDTIASIEGLVAAPMDSPTILNWGFDGRENEGCNDFITNATLTDIGDGLLNTMTVLNATCDSKGSAFEYVDTLTLNGYADWYLPAEDELVLLFQNLESNNIGGLNGIVYWSSSETSSEDSSFYDVAEKNIISFPKYFSKSVRAIRQF